jgi:hypothetical protein
LEAFGVGRGLRCPTLGAIGVGGVGVTEEFVPRGGLGTVSSATPERDAAGEGGETSLSVAPGSEDGTAVNAAEEVLPGDP